MVLHVLDELWIPLVTTNVTVRVDSTTVMDALEVYLGRAIEWRKETLDHESSKIWTLRELPKYLDNFEDMQRIVDPTARR